MKKIVRRSFIPLLASIAAFGMILSSCASGAKPVEREPGKTYELVVLHTNDQHGQVLARSDGKGGLASQATFVKQVREQNANVLLLSAGDINTGSSISNMFAAEPDLVAYNKMGYDAATFGNHEFDGKLGKLKKQMEIADFPWLSANIKEGSAYLGKPYIIKDFEGFRVAVIGLTTNRTTVIASPDKSLTFLDEIETAKEMVKTVREKELADIVIICSHMGDIEETETHETSVKLAEAVDGIDLIIDGHSHSLFTEPKFVNDTPIVTANEQGKIVGQAEFKIVDGKVTEFVWTPVEITAEAFPPDPEVEALLQPYVDKAREALKEVVFTTNAEFRFGPKLTRYREMASGDVLTDAMCWYVRSTTSDDGVDFAVTNGGGIRTSLPAGDVTREDIMTMLPFENYVYVLTLKGSDVVKLFDFIGSVNQGAGAFAQVSKEVSYTITYDADGKNGQISNVLINGSEIDPERTYRIATNDYMAGGGDGYVAFKDCIDTYNTSMLLSDVFIDYVKTLGEYTPNDDGGRITLVGGKIPE